MAGKIMAQTNWQQILAKKSLAGKNHGKESWQQNLGTQIRAQKIMAKNREHFSRP